VEGELEIEEQEVYRLQFAAKRRVFVRNEDGTLQLQKVLVSIDLSDFELT
jgi:hypothetical protein